MIVQTAPQGEPRLAITMDEHTTLASHLARAFGNETFEPSQPSELLLYLVANHDKGWMDWDASPESDPSTGLPYNLVDTPTHVIIRTSSASPEFNERHHPYCGLLSSMHSWGLYNGRYGMSDLVLIDKIAAHDLPLVKRMLDGELQRQARLKRELGKNPVTASWIEEDHLFQNYKQLQFFDTLALYFNRAHEEARNEATFKHVPINARSDATLELRPLAEGVYELAPFPFVRREMEFAFTGRFIEPQSGAVSKKVDWRKVFEVSPAQSQTFKIVAG